MNLQGKTAIVTGGAVRVGRAIARALAAEGCNLLLHYGRSADEAEAACREFTEAGVRCEMHAADLADPAAAAGVVLAGVEHFETVDFLINSAAIFLGGGLAETSLETWDRQFAINLRAPFLLTQAFAAQLPDNAEGAVINIVDARNNRPGTDHFAYRLTKTGLEDMTRNLALELAPRIRVNALALGAILPPPGEPPEYLERLARERVPLQRAGSAELVADNAVHLLRNDFITGTVLPLDGGEFL